MKISNITVNPSPLEKILYWLNPGVYLRNHKTSKALSQRINELLDNPETQIVVEDGFTVRLGPLRIWIENFPYSYGHLQDNGPCIQPSTLPDRQTVFRLSQVVEAAKEVEFAKKLRSMA